MLKMEYSDFLMMTLRSTSQSDEEACSNASDAYRMCWALPPCLYNALVLRRLDNLLLRSCLSLWISEPCLI
jgi:hypothetical protein